MTNLTILLGFGFSIFHGVCHGLHGNIEMIKEEDYIGKSTLYVIETLFPYRLNDVSIEYKTNNILIEKFGDPFLHMRFGEGIMKKENIRNINAIWDWHHFYYFKTESDLIHAKFILQ